MPRVEAPPRRAVLALAVAALSGCANLSGPIRKTMDVSYDDRACAGTQAPVLLLPGANMAPAELEREGFVAAVRERRLAQWLDGGLLPTSCAA